MLNDSLLAPLIQVMDVLMVVLAGFYALFSFVILRQVQLMNHSFKTTWGLIFVFIASLHFFAALALVAASALLVFF
jgi:hypothetical protein